MTGRWNGRSLVPGRAQGRVLVLDAPLSFWGGMDPHDGRVIDRHHPQHGQVLTGRAVLLPAGRGSSSSSSVLAEAIRLGTAPAALILGEADAIIALGALAAAEMYDTAMPIGVLHPLPPLADGTTVSLRCDGPGGEAELILVATTTASRPAADADPGD